MGGRGSSSGKGGSSGTSAKSGSSSGGSSGGGGSSATKSKVDRSADGSLRTTFSHQGGEWKALASKEYGAHRTVYITATNSRGTQYKSSYSKSLEKFTNYQAGHLDHAKAAASALGLTE